MHELNDQTKFHLQVTEPTRGNDLRCTAVEGDAPAQQQSNEMPDSRALIAIKAKNYYFNLWVWLIAVSLATFFFASIGFWAKDHRGWQAGAIEFFCEAITAVCGLTLFMLIILITSWHKAYKKAIVNAEMWTRDYELFQLLHRDAIGPIPWRK